MRMDCHQVAPRHTVGEQKEGSKWGIHMAELEEIKVLKISILLFVFNERDLGGDCFHFCFDALL